ncbi:hypothetical protein PIN31115_04483 [Pandoraea iniqua]|uniref:Uncharacterized protein n=1 Tax=Pandoraea iniqua TaxID=2508288 RepID=A0A5E4YHG6_9BURK|nr:hypothetical protein PIN31115_04483 [Pandoraea iniqua]
MISLTEQSDVADPMLGQKTPEHWARLTIFHASSPI